MSREPTTVPVIEPKNRVEAQAYASFLEDQGIECVVVSFRDTAYAGALAHTRPWGEVRVSPEDHDRAAKLIAEWNAAEPVEE